MTVRYLLAPVTALTCALTLSACSGSGDGGNGPVRISDAWCRPSPAAARTGACFLTLRANEAETLTSVASPAASTVQLHSVSTENGLMRMEEMPNGLALPAGQAVTLAPGGDHIMLMGLTDPLTEGETVSLTLGFTNAEPITVQAEVRQPHAR